MKQFINTRKSFMGNTESTDMKRKMDDPLIFTKKNSDEKDSSYTIESEESIRPVNRKLRHTDKNIVSVVEEEGVEEKRLKDVPLAEHDKIEMPDSAPKDQELISLYNKVKYSSVDEDIVYSHRKTVTNQKVTISQLVETVHIDGDKVADKISSNNLCRLLVEYDIRSKEELKWYASKIQYLFWTIYLWRGEISDYVLWCMSANLRKMISLCSQIEAFLNNDIKDIPKEHHKVNVSTAQMNHILRERLTEEKRRKFEEYAKSITEKETKRISIYDFSVSRLNQSQKETRKYKIVSHTRVVDNEKNKDMKRRQKKGDKNSKEKDSGSESKFGWNLMDFSHLKFFAFGNETDDGGVKTD